MGLFFDDNNITEDVQKATKIKLALGDEGMRRILASGLTEAEQKRPAQLWTLIESEVDASVKINFRVHRLELSNLRQKSEENISEYVSRLREKAKKCEFESDELNERLIEMVILSTPFEDFKKELLVKGKGHPIKSVIERGREFEAIQASQLSLKSMYTSTNVDALKYGPTNTRSSHNPNYPKPPPSSSGCSNCSLRHAFRSCPAFNDTCSACGSKGHWKKCCRKTRGGTVPAPSDRTNQSGQGAKVGGPNTAGSRKAKHQNYKEHEISVTTEPCDQATYQTEELSAYAHAFNTITISNVTSSTDSSEAYATLHVRYANTTAEKTLRLKVDTGAGGNTLPVSKFKQMFPVSNTNEILKPEPCVTLTSYSGNKIPCIGSITLQIRKQSQTHYSNAKFFVVDVNGPAIVGLPTCTSLGLVNINVDAMDGVLADEPREYPPKQPSQPLKTPMPGTKFHSVEDLMAWFPDCFDGIGHFRGEEHLQVRDDASPFIDPPRRVSIHLGPKIKAELDQMENDGIIRRVTKATDWCSSLTYALKKDGSLRVCLDPQRLNQALRRRPHQIPTVEEITPAFSKAKFFTKLDAKAGYWSIPLSESSQELTTFRTPFGRYCFRRLPFGLCISQDAFQEHMDRIIQQCEGCTGISDDVVIYGRSEEEHDERLRAFLLVARKEGLKLNSTKCAVKEKQITFFGRLYTDHGVYPDPAKVQDLNNMPAPKDRKDLERFLGLATFLGPHIPNLSTHAASLRDLTKGDTPFLWDEDHQATFEHIKQLAANNTGLQYYNADKPLNLEVDASTKGLGAALVQDGIPISFASKSLSPTQSQYSSIERECLALVHGFQRFHHYLYGRPFTVISDCKPLETIFKKPLHSAPPRLQRMMIKIQGYDFEVKYRPGSEMIIADTLSRLPNPSKTEEIPLDHRVDQVQVQMDLLNFSPARQDNIREETLRDTTLKTLSQVIFTGWPDDIKALPTCIRDFWGYRDELAIENGIVFKGRQVLIPETVRPEILKQLHVGHQGVEKTYRLARESVYWPRLHRDIQCLVNGCPECQSLQPAQQKEPLNPHEKPSMPWIKLGTDLFSAEGTDYLIIADYHSLYPVVVPLSSQTARAVITATKQILGLFGVPQEIVSDNGPCFLSEYDSFCSEWGITHTTSSPRYPRSNGFIENRVKYVKKTITKCARSGQDVQRALLNLRATPIDAVLPSPAELIFGRPVPTVLPSRAQGVPIQAYKDRHQQRVIVQKAHADVHAKPLPPLHAGQDINVRDERTRAWHPAKVLTKDGDREYTIATEGGSTLRRNRHQLREAHPQPRVVTPEPACDDSVAQTPPPTESQTHVEAHTEKPAPAPVVTSPLKPMTSRFGRVIRMPARFQD